MDIQEGFVPFREYRTYYRIVNPKGKKTPFLLLHGGPGSTHNSFELLDRLAELDDRPVISYDQIGCGLSFVEGKHPELFQEEVWLQELENLRKELSLSSVHIMGHSWGGMLLLLYMTGKNPKGVKSIQLSSTLSSSSLWREETHRLIRYLSKEDQEAIAEGEKKNDYSLASYKTATDHYLARFVSDVPYKKDAPECLLRPKVSGKEAYLEAWGPSEFTPLGSLACYDVTKKMKNITVPTLILSGTDDESTPLQNKIMLEALTGCKDKEWFLIPNSRHMTYFDQNSLYIDKTISFLNRTEK